MPLGQKKPREVGWQAMRLTLEELPRHFSNGNNIGVLNGIPSGGLVDTDLDCDSARLLADEFLPPTGLVSGRQQYPRSHHWFLTDPPIATKQFSDPLAENERAMLVELRSTGSQTLVAPSKHPTGDYYCWTVQKEPATVPGAVLLTAAAKLAACSLLSRYWVEGKRHQISLATAGMLLRAGWEPQTVDHFIVCAARAAGDTELNDRRAAIRTTLDAFNAKKHATGIPTLKTLLPEAIVNSMIRWLDLTVEEYEFASSETAVSLNDFWAHSPTHSYIYGPTREQWSATSVNSRVPPVATGGNKKNGDDEYESASTWLDRNRAVEQMSWLPGEELIICDRFITNGGWFDHPGARCFNLYQSPRIQPGNARLATLWVRHLHRLYSRLALHIICWFAHRRQRPQEKINHCLFLGGAPGIGKDAAIEPLKHAVGHWNFQDITPAQLLGRFNPFTKSVVLRMNEAHDLGDFNRFNLYEHTKLYMASPPDVIRVDEKNLREHYVSNVTGVIITSNHKTDGIFLPADDRRHFVAWSDAQPSDFSKAYWTELFSWYQREGFRHVAAYLDAVDLSQFDPKAPPPKTAAFWDIVDANRSPEDAELADVVDVLNNPNALTLDALADRASGDFRDWLRDRKNRRQIPHRLETVGYVPVRSPTAKDGLWKIGGRRMAVYAKSALALRDQITAADAVADEGADR